MKHLVIGWTPKWIALLCLLASAERTLAQFVEISADIEILTYRSDITNAEATAKTRMISVVCTTSTNLWRIENDYSLNGVNKWFFDGTNVYQSIQITKPLPEDRQTALSGTPGFATVPFDAARSNLTIDIWPSNDGHPLGDVAVNIPWLAFCSGAYLKREGRLIPLPCDLGRHSPDRYAYSDQTQVFHDGFGLPSSIDLFLSKSLYVSSVEGFYAGWGDRYLPWMKRGATNLQEGTLTFHYSVTATTNFLSWTLPLRFEFYQEGRHFIQNGDWFTRGTGTLKSIREAPAPQNVFDPTMQQTVVDWRFRDEETGMNANIYPWVDSSIPETNAPGLQDKFKSRVEQARRHKEESK